MDALDWCAGNPRGHRAVGATVGGETGADVSHPTRNGGNLDATGRSHAPDSVVRRLLDAALAYSGGSHTVEDVLAGVRDGTMQLWHRPNALIVTEVITHPRQQIVHIFLAAGKMDAIEALADEIEGWARAVGCTKARLVGRRGWTRSFLQRTGWRDTEYVTLERDL